MRGRYANPYANLGNSVGGIINAFSNRDIAKGAGYNQGAATQSNINLNNANVQKIMDELQRGQRGDETTWQDMAGAGGTSPQDQDFYEAMRLSDGANFGPGVMPPGMAGPPTEFMTDRPASFTPQDEEIIRNAQTARTAQTMGGKLPGLEQVMGALEGAGKQNMMTNMAGDADTSNPNEVRAIMAALDGSYPPEHMGAGGGGADWSNPQTIVDMLPKSVMPTFIDAYNKNGGDALGALEEVVRKADAPTIGQIMTGMGQLPMGTIDLKVEGDEEQAREKLAQWVRGMRDKLQPAPFGGGSKGKGTRTYDVHGEEID